MMHQSSPSACRRRVSQPSIHLPRSVYLPSMKTGAEALSSFSFGAKNSSLVNSTAPPRRSEARSISSVMSIRDPKRFSHEKECQKSDRQGGQVALAHARASDTNSSCAKQSVRVDSNQTRRHHKLSAREEKSFLLFRSGFRRRMASVCGGDGSFRARRETRRPDSRLQCLRQSQLRSNPSLKPAPPAGPVGRKAIPPVDSSQSRARSLRSTSPANEAVAKRFRPRLP